MLGPGALTEPAWTSHVLGRAVLQAAVRVLAAHDIPVMPLKGLWLQQFVYGEAGDRRITDVDVLVPEGMYRSARRALASAGFQLCSANVSEAAYRAPNLPLPLDLHRRLFTRAAFHVSVGELFERGTHDQTTFGVPVIQPDPADVLMHLIGHALKAGTAWLGRGHELRDMPRLLAAFELSPAACAERLEQTGLARAARFVLPLTAADDPGLRGPALLSCLRSDPAGELIAACTARLRSHMADAERVPVWPAFALDSSVPRGVAAFLLRLWDKPLERRRHERP